MESLGCDDESMVAARAKHLFILSDPDGKGYITRKDMHLMRSELPLTQEQLDTVFDTLDANGNGLLTLEEFLAGFEQFACSSGDPFRSSRATEDDDELNTSSDEGDDEDVCKLLEEMNVKDIFQDVKILQQLWKQVQREATPRIQKHFEIFLQQLADELRKRQEEQRSLEEALKVKSETHDEEVRRLFEEMEAQLNEEKQSLAQEEKWKEKRARRDLEELLENKDIQMQELFSQHQELAEKLQELKSSEVEAKQENSKLLKEKEELEARLERERREVAELQQTLEEIRKQTKYEKRRRASSAFRVCEGIALEREGLVRQLQLLRAINTTLMDEKDARELNQQQLYLAENIRLGDEMNACSEATERNSLNEVAKCSLPLCADIASSITDKISANFKNDSLVMNINVRDPASIVSQMNSRLCTEEEDFPPGSPDYECDDNFYLQSPKRIDQLLASSVGSSTRSSSLERGVPSLLDELNQKDDEGIGSQSECLSDLTFYENEKLTPVDLSLTNEECKNNCHLAPWSRNSTPDRVFKIVMLGDPSVGKTSFIHRFCNDQFKQSYSATVGVDFRIKHVVVRDRTLILQLWDTAGQERFRSITRQYYRKADGVFVMYDVTSEESFKNVRQWISNVRDDAGRDVVIVLAGNKCDLVDKDTKRQVPSDDGLKLSQEVEALFYETSAKSGKDVYESMYQMASLLQERQDEEMERALRLSLADDDFSLRRKRCC